MASLPPTAHPLPAAGGADEGSLAMDAVMLALQLSDKAASAGLAAPGGSRPPWTSQQDTTGEIGGDSMKQSSLYSITSGSSSLRLARMDSNTGNSTPRTKSMKVKIPEEVLLSPLLSPLLSLLSPSTTFPSVLSPPLPPLSFLFLLSPLSSPHLP